MVNGRLPLGLSLNATTGLISGTPRGQVFTYVFTVVATDSSKPTPQHASARLSITITMTPTTTKVTSSANPSNIRQSVTFTAMITPSTATGSVTFRDGTKTLATVRTGVVVGSSRTATFTTSALTLGSHSITAQYVGSPSAAPSTSAVLAQTVDKRLTATWVNAFPATVNAGQRVQLTIGIQGAGTAPPAPTGTVTVFDGATPIATATIGAVFDARNNVTLVFVNLTALAVGTHVINASYAGDANYTGSASMSSARVTVGP
jgi:hypothetical protein